MPPSSASLTDRFRRELDALGLRGTGAHVLVALSGGMDSVTLLHLLRFAADDGALRVSAAHFDHAMRPGSDADARWVAGLCRAWGVPLRSARADSAPTSEAEARDARYRFLRAAQADVGATHLATAHHADDQAETVLFRVLRGTGLRGLAGIPAADGTGLVRPLLPFWRAELRAYARAAGLRWRTDPSNAGLDPARNRLRHRVLPQAERVAPGARRALVRLAALARDDEAAWEPVLAPLAAEA
ncbi:MAG TPA: tRNA lysidine(34) synthetase TilS, partial [Longimicrobium sp.]|uniref:tRNA lysidine(34) synthetase TilS n=1 Tax=Longimicrobium sp. TaxID=2029185 RepID=UPI002EDA13B8